MSVVATLLWKEWRDHKVALVAFPIAIAPLIVLGVTLLPPGFAKDPALPTFVMFGAFAIAALTLVCDLVPGEEQRGTIALLRRMPCGLARAFTAKLLFATIATLALCAVAYVVATVASALLADGPWFPRVGPDRLPPLKRSYGVPRYMVMALWCCIVTPAAWMFVVSTWLPRGTLALPAAGLVLALFGAPIALAFLAQPGLAPTVNELSIAALGLVAAAPIVAGFSFVRGRRHGGGVGASAWRGLLVTLLLFVPAYGRTAWRVLSWDRIDPTDRTFRVESAGRSSFVGAGGRYAFLTARHVAPDFGPSHALAIDLSDGSWRELGVAGEEFRPLGNSCLCVPVPFVARFPTDSFQRAAQSRSGAEAELSRWIVFDATTLETAAAASLEKLPDPFDETAEESAFQRAANSLRLPDGRHVWLRGRELVTDTEDGGERVLHDSRMERKTSAVPIGLGMRLFGGLGKRLYGGFSTVVYDAVRERRFELPKEFGDPWVRPGRWIVEREVDRGHRERLLYDPATGESAPLPAPIANAEFRAVLEDGRMLALIRLVEDSRLRAVAFVDPETGACEAVELPSWFGGRVRDLEIKARTPAGALVAELRGARGDAGSRALECFARLDFARRRFVAARDGNRPHDELLGCLDEQTLILLEGHRVIRACFGDTRTELLFPR